MILARLWAGEDRVTHLFYSDASAEATSSSNYRAQCFQWPERCYHFEYLTSRIIFVTYIPGNYIMFVEIIQVGQVCAV